jgi:hypothetical protein
MHPRTRYALTAVLSAAAAVLVFVGTASRYNPTFEGRRIRELAADISREIGSPVRGGLRISGERLVLELRYSPRDELYLSGEGCALEMRSVMETAAVRFTGFADEISVVAEPSGSVPLIGDVPPVRQVAEGVSELRRRFDRKQILESGERLWPLDEGVAHRPWRYVVIHHSAGGAGSAESFDRWHRQGRGWEGGLGYHFVIGNGSGTGDGEIEAGQRWSTQSAGAHAKSLGNKYNEEGIGICLVGNFSTEPELATEKAPAPGGPVGPAEPTRRQIESLRFLVLYLCLDPDVNIQPECIMGHRDVPGAQTICPGGRMPREVFAREVRRDLDRLRRARP